MYNDRRTVTITKDIETLPLELFLHILSFLNTKDLLIGKLVNRSWYYLIKDIEGSIGKPQAIEYLKKLLHKHIPEYPESLNQYDDYDRLVGMIRIIKKRTKYSFLSKSLIAIKTVFNFNQNSRILKSALYSYINSLQFNWTAFFSPTILLLLAFDLTLSYVVGTIIYFSKLAEGENPDYLSTMGKTPQFLASAHVLTFVAFILLVATYYLLTGVYQNIIQSASLYRQGLLESAQNQPTEAEASSNIRRPIEFLTISWQRSAIFKSPNSPQHEETLTVTKKESHLEL